MAMALLVATCGTKSLTIDNAEEPATFTLAAPPNTHAIEINATGLLSDHARLHFYRGDNLQAPWKTIDLIPVIVSGIPMGISPTNLKSDFYDSKLTIRYEPGRRTQGHIEITYRFKTS